ncbi:MAG: hypothetical protein KME23_05850 [Goleter apudmare HA4340-LM2]|jgi:hypothetical protein|nr:hypothetical protein [Goleter apudmare HA4340-LM2]
MFKLLDYASEQLVTALEDIITNIEIHSNFCIFHPDYQPFVLPTETAVRFQKLPEQLQQKYLNLLLVNFIYGIYYNGSLRSRLAKNSNSADLTPQHNLQNQTSLGAERAFYERLHACNYGTGYFDPGWQVIQQESDDSLVVSKSGLILHIERQRHLQPLEQSATVGDVVNIRMPKNLMQNGFYVAVGNIRQKWQSRSDIDSAIVRIYFNLQPEGAIALMGNLTEQLNQDGIPFTFKVLYHPSTYLRYDSGVLYFERSYYQKIRQVVQNLFVVNQPYFHRNIPLFSKFLAPGIGLAEEPDRKFTAQESFGINRCRIIADGLLDAWRKGQNTPEEKMQSIDQSFSQMGIKWYLPYLNANSEDIYISLY